MSQTIFWRLVHLLPFRVTRLVCDMCRELPKDLGRQTMPRNAAWSCPHYSITIGNALIARPVCLFGCEMVPTTGTRTTAS